MVSRVVRAADNEGGIPEAALVNLIATMVVGGHDTTMTMLSNALLYLLTEQPAAWARLAVDEQAAEVLTERLPPGRCRIGRDDVRERGPAAGAVVARRGP